MNNTEITMTKLASNAAVKSHFITFEVIDKTKSHLAMKAILKKKIVTNVLGRDNTNF